MTTNIGLMSSRQTNLALLAITVLAVLSGFAAFGVGTRTGRWVVVSHGVLGLSLLVLSPWKSMIARRGMGRERSGQGVSLLLAAVVPITLISGLILVSGWADRLGPLTMTQIHVGSGLVSLALVGVHYAQRPVRLRTADANRRNAIRSAGILGAGGLLYLAAEGVWRVTDAPGARRRFTGSHEIVEASRVPATQWLNDRVQHLDASTHRVRVAGKELTVAALSEPADGFDAVLDCTGGWYSRQHWSGTRLDRLLTDTAAESIVVHSVTGYWRRFPMDQASRLLLATHLAGEPLPDGNGGPVRLVAPERRGYWWVKWVSSVEVDDLPPWWQPPLPLA